MAKLKRDERVCPFCAETIKSAASRCRYCQSDVTPRTGPQTRPQADTEPASHPEPVSQPEPVSLAQVEPAVDGSASESDVAEQKPARSLLQRWLTPALATLVVLAAVAVGVAWWQAEDDTPAVAPSGTLVGYDARTQVLVEAADLTQRTLSYNYKTLENDMEVARARMTPSFRKTYDSTMAQVKANTEKNEIVLEAVVVSSAIIEATEDKAKVLVFVNQTTTAGTGDDRNQQLTRNSLVVTLAQDDGDWAMAKLKALS